jgi:hypothetical protein
VSGKRGVTSEGDLVEETVEEKASAREKCVTSGTMDTIADWGREDPNRNHLRLRERQIANNK